MGFVIFASLGVLRIAWGMETASAWDLQAELLCLPATGGSVRQMQRLSHLILNACTDVPRHVEELARIGSDHNRERNLHRWANRQAWRALLPDPYEFTLPLTTDGIHEHEGQHACLLPHETFASLFTFPELSENYCREAKVRFALFGKAREQLGTAGIHTILCLSSIPILNTAFP